MINKITQDNGEVILRIMMIINQLNLPLSDEVSYNFLSKLDTNELKEKEQIYLNMYIEKEKEKSEIFKQRLMKGRL